MLSPSPTDTGLVRTLRITGTSVYVLTSLVAAALIWAYLVQVDVSVRTTGIVRPEGNLVRLASESAGNVDSIEAVEGDLVQAGDSLVRLADPENETELRTLEEQMTLLLAALDDVNSRVQDRAAVYRIEIVNLNSDIEDARSNLARQRAEYEAMRHSARIRLERARQDFFTSQSLLAAGLVSQQSRDSALAEFRLARAADQEVRAREPAQSVLDGLIESADLLTAVFKSDERNLRAEATPLKSELARLRLEQARARVRLRQRVVRSPIAGRITFLARIHPGEYLPQGTLVATLSPVASGVVVEALVSNREVENVRPGQTARLMSGESVRMDGSVLSVSLDALFEESAQGGYRVVIAPDDTSLRLGMALEVRLITHTERLLPLVFRRLTRRVDEWAGS